MTEKPTMRMVEIEYLEWAGAKIKALAEINADLLKALRVAKGALEWMADATDSDPEDHERLELVNNAIEAGNAP